MSVDCTLQVRSRRVTGAEHEISTLEAALQAGPSSAMLLGPCPFTSLMAERLAQRCQCKPGPCSALPCVNQALATDLSAALLQHRAAQALQHVLHLCYIMQ